MNYIYTFRVTDLHHPVVMNRLSRILAIFGDEIERDEMEKEIQIYLKRDPTFLDEVEKRKDRYSIYKFLNEWSSRELEGGPNDEPPPKEIFEKRLYYMYLLNNLTPKHEPLSLKWAKKLLSKYPTAKHWAQVLFLGEERHGLKYLGVKWEEQHTLRQKYGYEGKYLLDRDGYARVTFLYPIEDETSRRRGESGRKLGKMDIDPNVVKKVFDEIFP